MPELTEMSIQLGVHNSNQLLESRQLLLHPALVPQEVLFLRKS